MSFAPSLKSSGFRIVSADQIGTATVQRENHTPGAVRSEHLGLSGNGFTIAAGSTTDTTNYTTLVSFVITTTMTRGMVLIPFHFQCSHSVSGANIDIQLALYFNASGSTGGVGSTHLDLDLPTANEQYLFSYTGVSTLNLAGYEFTPGEHLVAAFVRPDTAGTLTWRSDVSNDAIAYVIGRDT